MDEKDAENELQGAIDEVEQASQNLFERVFARHVGGEPTATLLTRHLAQRPSAQAVIEAELRRENARVVGPSGLLTEKMKLMPKVPKERRRDLGQRANGVKQRIEAAFEEALALLSRAARQAELEGVALDPTLPARNVRRGRLHPLTRTMHEVLDVLVALGFDVEEAPEIDLAAHNFDQLGFPPDHPATDMQDSFFVSSGGETPADPPVDRDTSLRFAPLGARDGTRDVVLRTHTTTIQVHQMRARKPPMAVVAHGAVYRRDDDATHSPMFAQIDGFAVDEGLTMAHLKGVLTAFVQRLFGDQVPVRMRPSYFPFVEPGAEVDMGCVFCRPWEDGGERSRSCRVCKSTGWMEILGCGMIHPVVFEHAGIDASRYTGFAFGMGIDRMAMLRHGVGNIRLLYENDVRFLGQL